MKNLGAQVDGIKGKNDFIFFMSLLINDLKENPHEWENKSLEDYLDAIERWVESIEQYYKNNNIDDVDLGSVNWRVFADVLLAAKYYE
ncbi:MAG: hypothetical protein WBP13_01625 [Methylophilaceae bacterium]